MDHIVVDVEIQKTIEETIGGWNATDQLGVAVACVWEYQTQRMRIYGPNDIDALRKRLTDADRISGYNIFNFDFPVIWGIEKRVWLDPKTFEEQTTRVEALKKVLLPKTDDMLRRIWRALGIDPDRFNAKTHGGTSLDSIARVTLGKGKIGNGADAPLWYKQGYIHKVINYCADDVALERDLTDFVERHNYVICNNNVLMIPTWKGGV